MLDYSSSSINNQNNLIFIDSQVDNYLDLLSGVENAEVVILEPDTDGIENITNILSQYEDISSVQIISHGNSEYLQLGETDLSVDNLDNYRSQLQQWSTYLDDDADILLFGCQVGSNPELIESLRDMTQADVAASVNLTGNQELGGDWQLEIKLGEIESQLAIDRTVLESYNSILAASEIEIDAYISQDWGNGYKLEVDLTAEADVDDWQLDFDFDQTIRAIYGVDLIDNGSDNYSIQGFNNQADLNSEESVKAIFIIDGDSSQASIPNFMMPNLDEIDLPIIETPVILGTPVTEEAPISETPTEDTDDTIEIDAYISQDWGNGYKLEVDLTAEADVDDWQLDFDFNQTIRAIYNVELVDNGSDNYSIQGFNNQADLNSGESVKAIFIIDGDSSQASIPNFMMPDLDGNDLPVIETPVIPVPPVTTTDDTIEIDAYISQDWGNGYKLEVDLTAEADVDDWQLDFDFNQTIRAIYNVELVDNGSDNYSIQGFNNQTDLNSGESVKAIFIIDGDSSQASIPNFMMPNLDENDPPIIETPEEPNDSDVPPSPVLSPQKFTANNELFNYDGRIDLSNPQVPTLGNPGTSIEFKFTGTMLQIELSEDAWGSENYIDVYLDDNPEPITIKLRREGTEAVTYDIASNLENKVHNAVIYKRNDYSTGEFGFHSITIDGELLTPNPDSQRTIEIYGDSISSGIAVEYPIAGVQDPQGSTSSISNAYYSYGSILARNYDAEVSLVAQGGVSLVDGFGFWNNGTGGEAIYDKVKPLDNAATWDFNNYAADLVIVAYGQNDSSTVGHSLSPQQWKERYKQLIANLRDKHPEAYFVGMFPNMFHNRQWDEYIVEAIAEYRQEYNDDKVFSLIHEQVTPGHPRISEQELMADTLEQFIDGTLSANGFDW